MNTLVFPLRTILILLLSTYALFQNGAAADRLIEQNTLIANSRWAVDFATRRNENLETSIWSAQQVVGFDLHKVFTDGSGDIGTLVFQPYLVKLSNVDNPPFFFDGEEYDLTWRITNFNFTKLSNGQFNIRAGHFEIPFGLEQIIDTNGTLRQFSFANRNIKADWGVSINGVTRKFDYELAATRGSGNNISTRNNPRIVSGRIGTPSYKNFIAGLSFFNGDVLGASGTTNIEQIGLDLAYYLYSWELLFEWSDGTNQNNDTTNLLTELSWRNRTENLHAYLQFRDNTIDFQGNRETENKVSTGFIWSINRVFSFSAQWTKELENLLDQDRTSAINVQFRARI